MRPVFVVSAFSCLVFAFACTSSNNGAATNKDGGSDAAAQCATAGGPVSGAADNHCGSTVQETNESACHPDAAVEQDAGHDHDHDHGDDASAGGGGDEPYGPTQNNAEGDDDDCKYHVSWTASSICQSQGVTFTVTVKKKTDNSLLAAATTSAEVFLDETHPAPNSGQEAQETSPGVYAIGPIVFDKPGKWTVRFHINEQCEDLTEDSPHGHVAFFVTVP